MLENVIKQPRAQPLCPHKIFFFQNYKASYYRNTIIQFTMEMLGSVEQICHLVC